MRHSPANLGHGAPEDAAEGDEDDIEIDVVEGESRVAKRGTLKREANSLNHKLTHRYKNPYCDSRTRAKMKHFKTRRGAYKRELKKFGDLITGSYPRSSGGFFLQEMPFVFVGSLLFLSSS